MSGGFFAAPAAGRDDAEETVVPLALAGLTFGDEEEGFELAPAAFATLGDVLPAVPVLGRLVGGEVDDFAELLALIVPERVIPGDFDVALLEAPETPLPGVFPLVFEVFVEEDPFEVAVDETAPDDLVAGLEEELLVSAAVDFVAAEDVAAAVDVEAVEDVAAAVDVEAALVVVELGAASPLELAALSRVGEETGVMSSASPLPAPSTSGSGSRIA